MVEFTAAQKALLHAEYLARLAACVPWTRQTRWQPQLNIVGASYPRHDLFPEVRPSEREVGDLIAGEYVDSPRKNFRYAVRIHRRGRRLQTWWGPRLGDVLFDSDIEIPILFERAPKGAQEPWKKFPWMSLTPGEILTLRVGTKLAKGKVVIGGLGLGYQLLEVCKRTSVTEVVLVEHSQELVDWMLPRVRERIDKKISVMVGDAFQIIPTLEADVALIDVYPNYGCNHEATAKLARKCRGIRKVWGWGTSEDPRRM